MWRGGSAATFHVRAAPDLRAVVWLEPATQAPVGALDLRLVTRVAAGPAAAHKATLFGKKASPDACFSLLADRDDNGLYLECQDAAQAKKWVDACTKLLATFRTQPHML